MRLAEARASRHPRSSQLGSDSRCGAIATAQWCLRARTARPRVAERQEQQRARESRSVMSLSLAILMSVVHVPEALGRSLPQVATRSLSRGSQKATATHQRRLLERQSRESSDSTASTAPSDVTRLSEQSGVSRSVLRADCCCESTGAIEPPRRVSSCRALARAHSMAATQRRACRRGSSTHPSRSYSGCLRESSRRSPRSSRCSVTSSMGQSVARSWHERSLRSHTQERTWLCVAGRPKSRSPSRIWFTPMQPRCCRSKTANTLAA